MLWKGYLYDVPVHLGHGVGTAAEERPRSRQPIEASPMDTIRPPKAIRNITVLSSVERTAQNFLDPRSRYVHGPSSRKSCATLTTVNPLDHSRYEPMTPTATHDTSLL